MNDWAIAGMVLTPLLALFGFFIKHISASNRHPRADKVVFTDVCEERGEKNDLAHEHLKEGIKDLKADMRVGFTKIETLIQAIKT
jgi:hypothetical protein